MDEKLQLGSESGILLDLFISAEHEKAGLGWGLGQLSVQGVAVWNGEDNGPVQWTWIDLLEWLGCNWPWILLEQHYPVPVAPLHIGQLLQASENRWEDMSEDRVEEEEMEVHRFLGRHDLASGLKGIFLPTVLLLRQGNAFEVVVPDQRMSRTIPFETVLRDLEEIGEGIAARAGGKQNGRNQKAVALWNQRRSQLQQKAIQVHSGLSDDIRNIVEQQGDANFWELDASQPFQESEVLAAARMTRRILTPEHQRTLLLLIKEQQKKSTPGLDQISEKLLSEFKEIGKPHDQGHWAAQWLRRELNCGAAGRLEPEKLLGEWGVPIRERELADSPIHAVACWGPRHGPAIILNTHEASTASHPNGRRTTLAHEICHLLIDRSEALPVAEVLNGATPERLEKRARAFAAELLLPRSIAAKNVREASDVQTAIEQLSKDYAVSRELVCWQIHNSEAVKALTARELTLLDTLKG